MTDHDAPTTARDIVPVLAAADVTRTLHRYRDAGFTARIKDDTYGYLRLGDARLHVARLGVDGEQAPPSTCLIFVGDPDALAEAFRAAGHGTVEGPQDRPWGLREGVFRDPDGNVVRFGRRLPGEYA